MRYKIKEIKLQFSWILFSRPIDRYNNREARPVHDIHPNIHEMIPKLTPNRKSIIYALLALHLRVMTSLAVLLLFTEFI